ncbi:class I SAM-dependent methyltransferase [Stomatohabitans albus]|uniref:class I SAM-dependent methyltransferase n=1 Tax=Stomatohabitans albus TaxID=3110766 RepID=UPI00300D3C5B
MSIFHELLERWNIQQRIFMEHREHRVHVMASVINELDPVDGRPIRVLDLGCGPGSVSHTILEQVPNCQIVGVDRDPVLLRIAAETNPDPSRFHIVDANLSEAGWLDKLPFDEFDAMVSATALHWLSPAALVSVYAEAAKLIRPGGVLLNADHLYYSTEQKPVLGSIAERLRDRYMDIAISEGAQTWEAWWDEALAVPEMAVEAELHRERWAERHAAAYVTRTFHLEAMRAAGCSEADVIWREFDDIVLCGVLST